MSITTENLEVGMEVKNYKELCELLGVPESKELKANSKTAFLKTVDCYIDYDRVGQKFFIKEIYDEPLEKIDKRLEGLHSKYINILMCAFLVTRENEFGEDNCSFNMTPKAWFNIMGLCNSKYKNNRYYEQVIKESPDSKKASIAIRDFYLNKDSKLKRYLNTSLKQMSNRRLINYRQKTMLHFNDLSNRLASDKEENDIRRAEKVVLMEMGVDSIFDIAIRGKAIAFYKNVLDELQNTDEEKEYSETLSVLHHYYQVIEINYTKSLMEKDLEKMIKQYKMEKDVLIEMAFKSNNSNTIDSFKNSNEITGYSIIPAELQEKYDMENYLIDTLIKIDDSEISSIYERNFATKVLDL